MRTFGIALATVLCAIQVSVALPRPDFGLSIEVFGGDNTESVAQKGNVVVSDLSAIVPATPASGYAALQSLLDEVFDIRDGFTGFATEVFDAINTLASSGSDIDGSFGAANSAITDLGDFISNDVPGFFTAIDTLLENNEIISMFQDAFGDIMNDLGGLGFILGLTQTAIQSTAADAMEEGFLNQAILRRNLSPVYTNHLTIILHSFIANIQLVTYIVESTNEFVQMADDYIIEAGDVADSAVAYVDEGLGALVTEVGLYSTGIAEFVNIIRLVSEPNLDFSGLYLPVIIDIADEADMFFDVYGEYLDDSVVVMEQHYADYQAAIPDAAHMLADFYTDDACDHIYQVVTVLINHGPYAEYCFNKYGPDALALFDAHARLANQCVDTEITRLLMLQRVLHSIAELMVFSIEDLLELITFCVSYSDECNASGIEGYLHELHMVIEDEHLTVLEDLVDFETDAGLKRLEACIASTKYQILDSMYVMIEDIDYCEVNGPYELD